MIKISNKTYYRNHQKNLEKYLTNGDTLNIIGSKNSLLSELKNSHYIDPSNFHNFQLPTNYKRYNTVIFSEFFETSGDIYHIFNEVKQIIQPNGKLIISVLNYRYSLIIKFFELLNLKNNSPKLTHINEKYLKNFAESTGFEFISSNTKQIIPFKLFGILSALNFFLEVIFNRFNFGLNRYIVFKNIDKTYKSKLSKCVIIPAKNEAGNIPILFEKISQLDIDEIIFSIGESVDNTIQITKDLVKKYKYSNIKILKQSKNGKANAIWEGLELVESDLIAILDSDLSVDPLELRNFFNILENNYSDFVNGTRLIYPMEKNSMRRLNLIGNRVFQSLITFVIGVKLSDSLCGTKVFKKEFISKIKWWQQKYNLFDPFCDFDLLFTAAITGEKILEYPVNYKSRIYGTTQISRFRDGYKLGKYLLKAFKIFHTT